MTKPVVRLGLAPWYCWFCV